MRAVPALLIATLSLAAGCPKSPATLRERADSIPWEVTPSLPAPSSGTYGAAPGAPRDPIVRMMIGDLAFDRALESASAGLALDAADGTGGLARWELREASWRGGWPYPVSDARGWATVSSTAPPDDLFAWVESVPEGQPMALVRARGAMADAWVGMRAEPAFDLGALPREAPLGTAITLPPVPGAVFRLADGGGTLLEGPLDQGEHLLLTSAGEWLLQVVRENLELVKAPIYVGIPAPDQPLLRTSGTPPLIGTVEDADAWARRLFTHVRQAYRLRPWQRDPLLDAVAERLDAADARPLPEILTAVGLSGTNATVWTCDDVTVENCLDRLVWDPRKRAALLDTNIDLMGLHARLDARGVHLRVVLGGGG
jgi:hypothetical protein